MSTSGGVQYIGGYPDACGGDIMSTSVDVQYIEDTMSTSEGIS